MKLKGTDGRMLGVRERLADPDRWPCFATPDFSDRLESLARRSLEQRTMSGALASILVYHQLAEELMRVLVEDSKFLIQCSILPTEINFAEPKKQTFGQLLDELRRAVEFKGKAELLKRADDINRARNELAHGLTRRGRLAGIRKQALRVQRAYGHMFERFDSAHDFFRVCFKDCRKAMD